MDKKLESANELVAIEQNPLPAHKLLNDTGTSGRERDHSRALTEDRCLESSLNREAELQAQARELEIRLKTVLSALTDAQEELKRMRSSASWRALTPIHRLVARYPGIARRLRQGAKLAYWTASGQIVRRLQQSIAYRYSSSDPLMGVPAAALLGRSSDGLPVFLENYLVERWPNYDLDDIKIAYRLVDGRSTSTIAEKDLETPEIAHLLARLKVLAASENGAGSPTVSIIIPVYNALAHTLACLLSLLSQLTTMKFEIIVADDVSTDGTAAAIAAIGGKVHLVRPQHNLGFLRNCNAASSEARGTFIVFLNNDTIVMPRWLDELIAPLQADSKIGSTCSKLLNADGTLQEAGGIFWQDGSAWNYGRGADPRAYPFNFTRDTDYGSGAAMALRTALWKELGGFDDSFAPAYCEDADLAFSIRAKGYRTLYVPFSEVIHHEGVSHGRSVSSGIKAYQVANLEKFRTKWSSTLVKHAPAGTKVAQAASRSAAKARILIIDHYVPQPDRDAGSRSIDGYMRFLLENRFHVTFWSENQAFDPAYTPIYQRLGVEMVFAYPGRLDFREWIAQRGADFQYCLVSRPHVAALLLPDLKRYTGAKILFLGVDLHVMRLRAEREVAGSTALDDEIRAMEAMERGVWNEADVIYYPSQEEVDFIAKSQLRVPVRALPLYLFDDADISPRVFSKGNATSAPGHLLFVGGFAHRPNVDGILWFFHQVWPLIKACMPSARLTIAGSNPLPEIVELAADDLRVVGFVSDETLGQLYDQVDVAIAPLRFGAGVKGKVLEALRLGMPIAITSVAAQGIPDIANVYPVTDTAEAFAEAVIALLTSRDLQESASRKGQDLIRQHFSIEAVRKVLSQDMPELRRRASQPALTSGARRDGDV